MSGKLIWSRELICMLLVEYEEKENLYNPKHKDYINRNMREKSLEDILKKLKSVDDTISLCGIRNKIQILRSQYAKELRLVAASKKSGCGLEDVYEPKLWCFDKLNFLKPHCAIETSVSNLSTDTEQCLEANASSSSIEQLQSPFYSTPKRAKFQKNELRKQISDNLRLTEEFLNKSRDDGGNGWVAQLVVSQLNQIKDPIIQNNTVWDIQCALRQGIEADRVKSAEANTTVSPEVRDGKSDAGNGDFSSDSDKQNKINILSMLTIPSSSTTVNLLSPARDFTSQSLDGIEVEDEDVF